MKLYLIAGLMRLIRPLAKKNMLISREKYRNGNPKTICRRLKNYKLCRIKKSPITQKNIDII